MAARNRVSEVADVPRDAVDDDAAPEEIAAPQLYVKAELPPYYCRYCWQHDAKCVGRCTECNLWFCNSTGDNLHVSHLVHHMQKALHNSIVPHAHGPLGSSEELECYVCGGKNLFDLGFVTTASQQAIPLCRQRCQEAGRQDQVSWKPEEWKPVITEGRVASWFIAEPAREEMSRCRSLSRLQMRQLEELWKTNRQADIGDIPVAQRVSDLPMAPLQYRDSPHYAQVFRRLLWAERKASEIQAERSFISSVRITFRPQLNGWAGEFVTSSEMFRVGAELAIEGGAEGPLTAIVESARVTPNGNRVKFSLLKRKGPLPREFTASKVRCTYSDITARRMQMALNEFEQRETACTNAVFRTILGEPTTSERLPGINVPDVVDAPGIPKLNPSQRDAIRTVLPLSVGLIQGPPGTGKTTCCAALVYRMRVLNKAQVLVAAPSNTAVDHLAVRVAKTGLKVVRLFAIAREDLPSDASHLGLHRLVDEAAARADSELHRLNQLRQEEGSLIAADFERFVKLRREIEFDILANADVICCTCSGAGDRRLSRFRFKHVLIDEATQGIEPEAMIPICCGARQVILVGDHCQLGPICQSREAEAAGLGRSLFERQVLLGLHPPLRLEIQYRMHPEIAKFPSVRFYEGRLVNGVTAADRAPRGEFPWPNPGAPTIFLHHEATSEEFGSTGTSFLNRGEAKMVRDIVHRLLRFKVKPADVCVISPYQAQREFLVRDFASAQGLQEVEVDTVDAFQGREKDFVILTCVRASEKQGVGFLDSWQRANVALTRAKRGLIIVGNAVQLARSRLWNAIISDYMDRGLLAAGSDLERLAAIRLALPAPVQSNRPTGLEEFLRQGQQQRDSRQRREER